MTKYLILGGARSGKSLFAENLALKTHQQTLKKSQTAKLYYLATCTAFDDEMRQRILTHQNRRTDIWNNVEEPLNIVDFIQMLDADSILLIDCLTLWISNLMFEGLDIENEFKQLAEVIENSVATLIFVSNEVGMGLVPDSEIGREFRDFQGELNQLLTQKVDQLSLIVAGLPIWVK